MYLKAKISLLVVTVLWMTSQYTYVPILSSYANQLGASAFLIGMIGGATGVVSLCSRIPLSILSDKWNRKKVFIIFGMAVCFLAALVPSLIHTPKALLLGRALTGLAMAIFVHFTVLYASYYPKEKTGFAIGLINAGGAGGQLLGTIVCALIASRLGANATFYAAAIIALLGLVLAVTNVKEKKLENTEALTIGQLLAVVKIKRLLYYGILAAIAMYSFFSTAFGFTPLVAEQLFAANAAQLSMISSLALFASLISSVACSYIPNHVNNRLISFISFVGIGISTALIPFSPSLTFLYLMQTINGFLTNFMSVYLMVLLLKFIDPRQVTAATGIFQTIYCLGIAFGPIITGCVQTMTGNYRITFVLMSLLSLGATISVWRDKQKNIIPQVAPNVQN